MLIWLLFGVIPFLVGLVIGRWWALPLAAGSMGLFRAIGVTVEGSGFGGKGPLEWLWVVMFFCLLMPSR